MLGVSQSTLRLYAKKGDLEFIKTPGGQRRYDIVHIAETKANKYNQRETCLKNLYGQQTSISEKKTQAQGAIYCRVSSKKQEDDLERQIQALEEAYPGFKVFKDTCSGLNYKRKGLTRLLEQVQSGTIKTVVVAHKDRLARFATEIIE